MGVGSGSVIVIFQGGEVRGEWWLAVSYVLVAMCQGMCW